MQKAHVLSGLDRLHTIDPLLRGKRIGLMTNPTGVDHALRSGIDIFHESYNLSALFACEHGVRGNLQAGAHLETYMDEATGVTVYSCYGASQRLSPEMLDAFDVFVFDMQDVGARFYTYMYSLSYAMEACAAAGKPVVVLDRANPIGGEMVQGTLLDERFSSFVGLYAMPTRHGLTIGEYARWVKDYLNLSLELTVVPLEGWKRSLYLDETDVPWVAPSPNLATLSTATVFTGTCLFEATNVSEGRGTTQPFELIGAPWLDGRALFICLNALELPGIRFRYACFTPTFSKHAGEMCSGVQMHITNRAVASPFEAGLHMIEAIQALHGDTFVFLRRGDVEQMKLELLLGDDAFGKTRLDAQGIIQKHAPLVADFQRRTMQYRLYE